MYKKQTLQIVLFSFFVMACNNSSQEKNRIIPKQESSAPAKTIANGEPRVTGIGGIFFKTENPSELKEWYSKNLGLNTDQWGTSFEWFQGRDASQKGFTQWSPFSKKTTYFNPSEKEFMINYRVVHLEKLLEKLRKNGVTVLDSVATYDYGKFVHIIDNEGNKIELWEPNDQEYDKIVKGRTK